MNDEVSRPLRVFICYSHADEQWRERLEIHLRPLQRRFQTDIWSDKRLVAGAKWRAEIRHAIDRADIAVLIVSADFLASEFIQTHELPPLLGLAAMKGLRILPLIASPSLFEETEELAQFHAINDPSQPLISMSEGQRENTFLLIAREIRNTPSRAHLSGGVVAVANEQPTPPKTAEEDFLDAATWPALIKIGNWIFDSDRKRIIGSSPQSFLISQSEYGEYPFSIRARLTFSNFRYPPLHKKLGMNAGLVFGWKTERELVVPYYYNLLLTGDSILLELNGPYEGDTQRRWKHITEPTPFKITSGVPLAFEVQVDEKLTVIVNGSKLLTTNRPEGATGRVGLRPWRSQLECDEFRIVGA